ALGNGGGVLLDSAGGSTVGGTTPAARNLIAGNAGDGIRFDNAAGNLVQGNFIGTRSDGASPLGNLGQGVFLTGGSSRNPVGGAGDGAGNLVAFNGGAGIAADSGTGNLFRSNSIFSNAGLGIDLGADGVTPNDPGDPDGGANDLQNFPV